MQEVSACGSRASECGSEATELHSQRLCFLSVFLPPLLILFLSMRGIDSTAYTILRCVSQILPQLKRLFNDGGCGKVLVRNWGIKEAVVPGKD